MPRPRSALPTWLEPKADRSSDADRALTYSAYTYLSSHFTLQAHRQCDVGPLEYKDSWRHIVARLQDSKKTRQDFHLWDSKACLIAVVGVTQKRVVVHASVGLASSNACMLGWA